MVFQIGCRRDLVEAARLISEGSLSPEDLVFNSRIVESIKIDSPTWNDANEFDYRLISLMYAIQKDVIGIYNAVFNKKIKINNVCNYDFLQIKFIISSGCIDVKQVFNGSFWREVIMAYAKMPAKEKALTGLYALILVVAWRSPELLTAIKSNPHPENASIIREAENIVAQNQRTPNVIINNLNGGVVICNGKELSADMISRSMVKKDKIEIIPVEVNDDFFVHRYDYDKQSVNISHPLLGSFDASSKWLTGDKREKLKALSSSAIDATSSIKSRMWLSVKVGTEDNPSEAVILGIDDERAGTVRRVSDIISGGESPQTRTQEYVQLNLLEQGHGNDIPK